MIFPVCPAPSASSAWPLVEEVSVSALFCATSNVIPLVWILKALVLLVVIVRFVCGFGSLSAIAEIEESMSSVIVRGSVKFVLNSAESAVETGTVAGVQFAAVFQLLSASVFHEICVEKTF